MTPCSLMILAQSGRDGTDIPLTVIFGLLILLASWVAGKYKEMTDRRAGRTPPGPLEIEDDEEEDIVDIPTMLGLPPQQPAGRREPTTERPITPPRRVPAAAPTPPSHLPTARPVDPIRAQRSPHPAPERRSPPTPPPVPVRHPEARPTTAAPGDANHESTRSTLIGDLTASTPPRRTARSRFAPVTRAELRRAIVLNEILGKPVGMRDLPD